MEILFDKHDSDLSVLHNKSKLLSAVDALI
jgi:hypothetical protein